MEGECDAGATARREEEQRLIVHKPSVAVDVLQRLECPCPQAALGATDENCEEEREHC